MCAAEVLRSVVPTTRGKAIVHLAKVLKISRAEADRIMCQMEPDGEVTTQQGVRGAEVTGVVEAPLGALVFEQPPREEIRYHGGLARLFFANAEGWMTAKGWLDFDVDCGGITVTDPDGTTVRRDAGDPIWEGLLLFAETALINIVTLRRDALKGWREGRIRAIRAVRDAGGDDAEW